MSTIDSSGSSSGHPDCFSQPLKLTTTGTRQGQGLYFKGPCWFQLASSVLDGPVLPRFDDVIFWYFMTRPVVLLPKLKGNSPKKDNLRSLIGLIGDKQVCQNKVIFLQLFYLLKIVISRFRCGVNKILNKSKSGFQIYCLSDELTKRSNKMTLQEFNVFSDLIFYEKNQIRLLLRFRLECQEGSWRWLLPSEWKSQLESPYLRMTQYIKKDF